MKKLLILFIASLFMISCTSYTYFPPKNTNPQKEWTVNQNAEVLLKNASLWASSRNLSVTNVNEVLKVITIEGKVSYFQKYLREDGDFVYIENPVADCGECEDMIRNLVLASRVKLTILFESLEANSTKVIFSNSFDELLFGWGCLDKVCYSTGAIEKDFLEFAKTGVTSVSP